MFKLVFLLFSLLMLTIAGVNMNISRAVHVKVLRINDRHNQKPLFQEQKSQYKRHIEKGQRKMQVAGLMVLGAFLLLFIGKPLKLHDVKWPLPLLVQAVSWVFIVIGYLQISAWSERMFYVGDVRSAAPQGYLYTDVFSCYAICEPGTYFKTLWMIKACLLAISIALQVFLFKRGGARYNRLFITVVILDILVGSLIMAILHDNIDMVHRMIDLDFAPGF